MMINELGSIAAPHLKDRTELLNYVEFMRIDASSKIEREQKVASGQFFTPMPLARFMASMPACRSPVIRILDAGAGTGSLFAAVVAHLCQAESRPQHIAVTAYEIDEHLMPYLHQTMQACQELCESLNIGYTGILKQKDFIHDSVELLDRTLFTSHDELAQFDCVILNPPYRKIGARSAERKLLQRIGIEAGNLYAGFLALAVRLLAPSGELVAIIPRSFCNGSYFKHFRKNFLATMSLRRIHVFDSRSQAFIEDEVLQENIIIYAVKESKKPEKVIITSSTEVQDEFLLVHEVNYSQVVHPDDPQLFIHVVQDALSGQAGEGMAKCQSSLEELGLSVSTGRVVDFRARPFLRSMPEPESVPLLYSENVRYGSVIWPKAEVKKPQALADSGQTRALFVPNEYYVLVKRFSAKEEKKRIVAAVYDPHQFPYEYVGFENHLNYFHCGGSGLTPALARGLAAFLNSTIVDTYFRQFNGHTQVNATDLRSIKYPTRHQLETLGARLTTALPAQQQLDALIQKELFHMIGAEGNEQEHDALRIQQKIEEALQILKTLGFPRAQQNERSALTLLALLNLKPAMSWSRAESPLRGITPMMDFFREFYGKNYKPNTRETVRRQTVHQFLEAGLIVVNPDQPERPINSPNVVYQIEQGALELLRTFGTSEWEQNLRTYLSSVETLQKRYAQERDR